MDVPKRQRVERRTQSEVTGDREARALAATLGGDARLTRQRRRRTLRQLSDDIGISVSRLAELERGFGEMAPLATWVKIGIALGRPLAVSFSRELIAPEPADAGHLAGQELILRLARQHRRRRNVELATRPANPAAWADVALVDDPLRVIMLVEIVNRSGNLGADLRTTDRKLSELEGPAMFASGDGEPYSIRAGWLLVDTAANRHLVARFGEVLRTRFPGSSARWARCLAEGTAPPDQPAIAWIDTRSGRIYPLRWRA